jgi:hypothetical protein
MAVDVDDGCRPVAVVSTLRKGEWLIVRDISEFLIGTTRLS